MLNNNRIVFRSEQGDVHFWTHKTSWFIDGTQFVSFCQRVIEMVPNKRSINIECQTHFVDNVAIYTPGLFILYEYDACFDVSRSVMNFNVKACKVR